MARLLSAGCVLTLVAALSCAAIVPSGPLKMKSVDLGTSVDSQGRITAPTRTVDPQDTVYASIETAGGGAAVLHVRWYANGQLLDEQSQHIDPKGPAHFVFKFKPAVGWPSGKAGLLFWMNDDEKHSANFDVR